MEMVAGRCSVVVLVQPQRPHGQENGNHRKLSRQATHVGMRTSCSADRNGFAPNMPGEVMPRGRVPGTGNAVILGILWPFADDMRWQMHYSGRAKVTQRAAFQLSRGGCSGATSGPPRSGFLSTTTSLLTARLPFQGVNLVGPESTVLSR